jgi:signal transduction histidine kinase
VKLSTIDVLAVDDNERNLLALAAALEDLDVNVVGVRSGTEALRRLLTSDFALIILDVAMPEMDGLETASLIRARERSRRVPIIFLTAFAGTSEEMLRGYSLGAVDYLMKPILPEVLRAKVEVFADLFRKSRQIERQASLLREAQEKAHQRELENARRRWEREALEREAAEMAEAARLKDEFIALLSHELRNPLAAVVHALELLRRHAPAAADTRAPLETAARQAAHLGRLVDDLLDVGRMTAGKIELRRQPVLLTRIVHGAAELAHPLLEAGGHRLEVDVREPRLQVDADPTRLTQVLGNLVGNAARYSAPGGLVRVTAEREGDQAVLRVADSGPGFSGALLEKAFDLFVRGDGAGDAARGGLGVGLFLAKTLVELHGGTIVAANRPGAGAELTVRIPGVRLAGEADAVAAPRPAATRAGPCRIVLVEDSADIRDSLRQLLEEEGHEVHVAADGPTGLETILRVQPDCAVVDVGLPLLDGYGVARGVREAGGAPRPRLVALTGWGRAEDRARAEAAGFDAHLAKPIAFEELLAVLIPQDEGRSHVGEPGVSR